MLITCSTLIQPTELMTNKELCDSFQKLMTNKEWLPTLNSYESLANTYR